MKKSSMYLLTLAVMLAMLALSSVCSADKKVVAVMPIENVSGYNEHRVAEIMTEQLVDALYRSGRATVVERNQLSTALREIGFQTSGAVDPNQAIELGRITGAQYSLIGTVTVASVGSNTTTDMLSVFGGTLFRNVPGKFRAKVGINIRTINNQTGEVTRVVSAEGSETGNTAELALFNSCKEAADNFLGELLGRAVGVILDVDGDTVYIDVGTENGVKKGETFEVVREGKPIQRPDGGMIMKYIRLGKVKVIEVNSDHAICKITGREGGLSIEKGAIVRRIKK